MLYSLRVSGGVPSETFALQILSEWNHNYMLTSLVTYGDRIVAGDQISSVSILKVSDTTVHNVARDYGPLWPVCVEASDEANLIGANVKAIYHFTKIRVCLSFFLGCAEPFHVHFDSHTGTSVSRTRRQLSLGRFRH